MMAQCVEKATVVLQRKVTMADVALQFGVVTKAKAMLQHGATMADIAL